tara:strand:+ start:2779 stop:3891 length:1113 start_codon:yes stop_codon:yes gene_type:complete
MNKDELEKYKQSLPPGMLKDMQIGGKTEDHVTNSLAIGGLYGGARAALPALASGAKNLLKNEVGKMTISDTAFKKGMLPELTRSGIKNWQHLRPWKAFTPKMLATGPTPAAALGVGGLTIQGANQVRKNPLGIRDAFLNKIGTPEHYKRFAQYLTGGVKGDVVTELPRNILLDVVGEHVRGAYPDRDKQIPLSPEEIQAKEHAINTAASFGELTPQEASKQWNHLIHGEGGFKPNPNYNPKSTLLSTYGSGYTGSKRTLGSLGHLNFVPEKNDKGELIGYRIKDTWDVDPDRNYKPWKSKHHGDLIEGGVVAARAYDLAKKLGTAKDFKYDVFIPIDQYNELENEIKSKTQFQRKLETPREDKRPPHKIK